MNTGKLTPFFAWWCSLTMGELDQIERMANVDAARAGWNAAKQQNTHDPAVEPSDLVAAGDGLVKALAAAVNQIGCTCGDFGPCKGCTAVKIAAATAAEAWEEVKAENQHSPDCDVNDANLEGIRKPCNCGG